MGAFYSNVTIRHSTIAGNHADSDNNGTGNGGGVFRSATQSNLTLDHTIVARNFRSTGTGDDAFGALAARYCLIGDNTGVTITDNGGNQIGTSLSPINPLLGFLANNGGPMMTLALLEGSPAIDAGDPAALAGSGGVPLFDQRGSTFDRVVDGDLAGGARIDIGAYEYKTLLVDKLGDDVDGNMSPGEVTLREAIESANLGTADAITFSASLTSGGPAIILLTQGELAISDAYRIDGPGADLLTIDASGNDPTPMTNNGDGSRVFNVNDGIFSLDQFVSISGMTLTGGDVATGGGAILNTERLTIRACAISGNNAESSGGGINNDFILLNVIDCTISANEAQRGGGIANDGATNITGSTISGNTASVNGGGVMTLHYGLTVVRHSTITGNTAPVSGGSGIASTPNYQFSDTVTEVYSSIVSGNADFDVSSYYPNFPGSFPSVSSGGYNAIGLDDTGAFNRPGDQTGVNALLGPLANNGGPTMTHALLAGSPAIEAGDPNFDPVDPDGDPFTDDALSYDQRGAPFDRVFDGNSNGVARIDIGASELQPNGALGDYNLNGTVDAADYVVWRKSLSTSVSPPFTGADGDGDGIVDADDHGVWRAHFGQTLPPPGAGSGAAATISSEADRFSEPVVQLPAKTTSEPAETEAATARSASFAALETRSLWPDLSSRSRRSIHRYPVAASDGDDLPLLLAIDRVGRSPRQGSFVSDDSGNGEHRADDDESECEIDEPLATALAVRLRARCT